MNMKRKIIALTIIAFSLNATAQTFLGEFLKYSTLYTTGIIQQPMQESSRDYFVSQGGDVMDVTENNPFDYSVGIGLRKLARFDYEVKPGIFYTGQEQNITTVVAVGPVNRYEYNFHYESARQRGDMYTNQQYFLRHLGNKSIIKIEFSEDGVAGLRYASGDLRYRMKIGKKINLSIGGVIRTHKAYGFNPIEQYLENNAWWDLAYAFGYVDKSYGIDDDNDGSVDKTDWFWRNPDGVRIADTDAEFRRYHYKGIVNTYNDTVFSNIGRMGSLSGVAGLDIYHYSKNFWLHAYASVLPVHARLFGDSDYTYGKIIESSQWVDCELGFILGTHITKQLGMYAEASYQEFWGVPVYSAKAGINYRLR
jgi:hypothetical protein